MKSKLTRSSATTKTASGSNLRQNQ